MRASDGSGRARVSMTPKPVRAVIATSAMLTIAASFAVLPGCAIGRGELDGTRWRLQLDAARLTLFDAGGNESLVFDSAVR
jgi:hypothetical protein